MNEASPSSAFVPLSDGRYLATPLTRGPWDLKHQHAGPPIALVLGAIERAAAEQQMTHIARLTANLFRPVPIAELSMEVAVDYAGRNAAHFSARLYGEGKEIARFTGLAQREIDQPVTAGLPGHPLPRAPRSPEHSPAARVPFGYRHVGYFDLVETRVAAGTFFNGPSAIWFRLNHPIVAGEVPSVYQRVAVAADSGNGISAVLDLRHYLFVNSDLTINLLRRPRGEWVCLEARTLLGDEGSGLAESLLYDIEGVIGRATQSLFVRKRADVRRA
ncbi:MAG TPA: thioesterase family protein [Terriglobales bacterium]|nr:thioesterase family protein [Terriglobales bacterium]